MKISRALYEEMVAHAMAERPAECCGIVASLDGEALRVFPARNAAASPLRYEMDAADQIAIQEEIDSQRWDYGAIYHSHTRTVPYPSQTDINFAANWPGLEWVIVGLGADEPEVRCYLIEDGVVRELPLEVR